VVTDLTVALRQAGLDADDSALARSLYSTDASLYRIPPQVVVRPRDGDDVLAVLAVAREYAAPVTMRGAGTSIAGNAVGPGVVVDTSRHLRRVLDVDVEARTATVQPGVVHAALQTRAIGHGLRFGPDPSTHTRCTIGGMIGNNACGSRALGYGRTVDNVERLKVALADGSTVVLDDGVPEHLSLDALAALVDDHLALVRTEFGRFGRQVSGYSFEHLLPERGRRFDRFLVGSEGTLGVVLEATVRLVEDAPFRALVVLGHADMFDAADAVPTLLAADLGLTALEGLDHRITDLVAAAPELPAGAGWLFAEVTGSTEAEVCARAEAVAAAAGVPHRVVTDVAEQAALWRIREDGAGLAARSLRRPAHAGWEDAAVPPEKLGGYLRDFDALLRESGLDGVPYGHFGDGCVHVRIDFELEDTGGRARFREFTEAGADLVASYGGSMSGEHGDGRARSELLGRMYSGDALALMAQAKRLLDPGNLLNPGVLVDPAPLDASIRLAAAPAGPLADLFGEVHRCTGVGRCIADNTGVGGVMCPSYVATREEKDSTRGRARVLQDVVAGHLAVTDPAVEQALDLCLSCKGCSRDCPTGVDMAAYKAQVLDAQYAGRRRPASHYALGRLPDLVRRVPARIANAGLALGPLAKATAGLDRRRTLPRLAKRPARRSDHVQPESADVVIWLDTFSDRFSPTVVEAAVAVLEGAGQRVRIGMNDDCCGLTAISTGQLDRARRMLSRVLDGLDADPGTPVIALEPSCLAVLRDDAGWLLGRTAQVRTLAEHPEAIGYAPPDLAGTAIVAQPHCHHNSVLGWGPDERLLRASGAALTVVAGCCGMAGNFGMEKGHYEVSVAVAEHALLPAVREAGPDAVVLADGFSCRTQLSDLAGVRALHLAELLAGGNRVSRG
jgi:FAD/FMN-containing dehydrogenase/Fe-S oxidoreductase